MKTTAKKLERCARKKSNSDATSFLLIDVRGSIEMENRELKLDVKVMEPIRLSANCSVEPLDYHNGRRGPKCKNPKCNNHLVARTQSKTGFCRGCAARENSRKTVQPLRNKINLILMHQTVNTVRTLTELEVGRIKLRDQTIYKMLFR